LGVKTGELHNVVEFKQKKWMQPYIEGNNELRTLSKNDFEKDYYKLMNNSVFGKTMQNVRKQMQIYLTTDHKKAIKRFGQLNFKHSTLCNGLYMIENYKTEIIYDKPVYVGCAILDLSKLKMLEFRYNVIDKQFGDRAKLIYSDTDSFVYEIEHEDIYDWQKQNEHEWFDLSDSKRLDLKSDKNKKKLGFMKDELHSQILTEFIALSPKCYGYKYIEIASGEIKEKTKAKGVSTTVVEKTLPFSLYKKTLETDITVSRDITAIRSFNHQLFTITTPKDCLKNYYDKMKLINNIECIPFGFEDS
jgi:hypothetical protein